MRICTRPHRCINVHVHIHAFMLTRTRTHTHRVQCHGITSRKVPLHFGPRLTRNLEILPSKSLYSDLHGHRQERSPKLRFPLNQSSDASIPFHAVYRPRKTYSDHSFDDEMSVNRHRIHASTARTIDDSNINLNDNTSNHHHHHRNITNNNSAHHSSNSSSHQSKHSISDLHPPYHSHSRSNMHMYHSSNTTNNNNKCALRRHPVMAYTTAVVK